MAEHEEIAKEAFFEGYRAGYEFPDDLDDKDIEAAWECSMTCSEAVGRQW